MSYSNCWSCCSTSFLKNCCLTIPFSSSFSSCLSFSYLSILTSYSLYSSSGTGMTASWAPLKADWLTQWRSFFYSSCSLLYSPALDLQSSYVAARLLYSYPNMRSRSVSCWKDIDERRAFQWRSSSLSSGCTHRSRHGSVPACDTSPIDRRTRRSRSDFDLVTAWI